MSFFLVKTFTIPAFGFAISSAWMPWRQRSTGLPMRARKAVREAMAWRRVMGSAIVALSLTACTIEGGKPVPGQIVDCTDLRDGERFTMHSENIQPQRLGIGTKSCISGVDDNGQYRQMCDGDEAFLKCLRRGGSS